MRKYKRRPLTSYLGHKWLFESALPWNNNFLKFPEKSHMCALLADVREREECVWYYMPFFNFFFWPLTYTHIQYWLWRADDTKGPFIKRVCDPFRRVFPLFQFSSFVSVSMATSFWCLFFFRIPDGRTMGRFDPFRRIGYGFLGMWW